ncbi:MAG: WhiB family transcriptional regulator [Ilumatobacteraceae bacterium]|jgi:WhiB family redox-sensing transcriptional regulator
MMHATVSAYAKGCRCEACKDASAEYRRRYRSAGAFLGINLYEQHWLKDAKCGGMSTDVFFSDQPGGAGNAEAIEICSTCPVKTDCLEYALRADERFGVWGGKTPRQRLRIAAERRRALREAS